MPWEASQGERLRPRLEYLALPQRRLLPVHALCAFFKGLEESDELPSARGLKVSRSLAVRENGLPGEDGYGHSCLSGAPPPRCRWGSQGVSGRELETKQESEGHSSA